MAFDNEELNKRREERKKEKERYNAQMRLLKIGAISTAVVIVLCLAAILITKGLVSLPNPPETTRGPELEATGTTQIPETSVPEETVPDQVIHFVAGGDINITDKLVEAGATVNGYDYGNVLLDVSGVLSGGNLTSVNMEGIFYGDTYGSATANAPVQLLTSLRGAGVDFIQTANSYTNHNGLRGLQGTLNAIRGAGLEPVGSFADTAEFQKTGGFTIREVDGIKVAVVAFTKGMNGMGLPAGSEDCVNLLYTDYSSTYQEVDVEGISAILQAIAREKPDVTIALLHWGSEYNDKISKTQQQIQELMLAGGVDAIIGTHPHYVQQIVYDQQRGTVVAYSLGDLLSDGEKGGTNYSILLDLEITRNSKTGAVKITGVDYVPVFLVTETGNYRLLRLREAMYAYENNFVDKVSAETYEAMKYAMERIEARVNGK